MANQKKFKAQNLKSILTVVLVFVALGAGAAFYFGIENLRAYATEVDKRTQDATASSTQIDQLQRLKTEIAQNQSLIDRANTIFSTPDNYQSQALTDIKNHADQAGLSIASTQFGTSDSNAATRTITIKLNAPVSYTKLITFFNGIENNIPIMQVSSATLTHVEAGNSDSVTVGDIEISMSVK